MVSEDQHPARRISVADFDYPLPPDRIAQFPLKDRDASKLLVYRDGTMLEERFRNIGELLPENALLVFNDTRVIHARLIFIKDTGATIEIFCLEPLFPATELQAAFAQTGHCTWNCLVGNVKRWRTGVLEKSVRINDREFKLKAEKKEPLGDGCFAVEFSWEPADRTFSAVLEQAGLVPLPPYINRATSIQDDDRYQTVFARREGSVAAPTAGLHFTEDLLQHLAKKGFDHEKVTLHVGLGTFRPVSAASLDGHVMHSEKISVTAGLIRQLLKEPSRPVIAVGTTSVRTLESLYWAGVRQIENTTTGILEIGQWDPYERTGARDIPVSEALSALLAGLDKRRMDTFSAATRLMILPGYRFRIITGMITNFHMPQSTLLLLVAACIGDQWKTAYRYALENDFRFLSYGDACLFFRRQDGF